MSPLIIDLAIILILVFFAWRGAKKGLILTIFSFLALFVAFYGARYVTDNFHQPVANIIRPSIQLTIDEVLTDAAIPDTETEDSSFTDPDDEYDPTAGFTLRQVLTLLEKAERFPGLQEFLREAIEEKALEVTTTAAAAVSAYLAVLIAKVGLFGVSFVLILLLWFLISRALDLAFKLPILSFLNGAGGLLFGLAKGVIILLVLVWLGKTAGWITEANTGPVTALMSVDRLSAFLRAVVTGTYTA